MTKTYKCQRCEEEFEPDFCFNCLKEIHDKSGCHFEGKLLYLKQSLKEEIEKFEKKGFHRKDKDKRLISYWFTYNEMYELKKNLSLLDSEKEIEPTEIMHKSARETQSRMNGIELPIETNSHERSSPSEKSKGNNLGIKS